MKQYSVKNPGLRTTHRYEISKTSNRDYTFFSVQVRRVPPYITEVSPDVTLDKGESVNLSCRAVGSPMPYVRWMNEDSSVTQSETVSSVGNTSLLLTNVQESEEYICEAESDLGKVQKTVKITVKN